MADIKYKHLFVFFFLVYHIKQAPPRLFFIFFQKFEKRGREEKFANFVDKRARVWYNKTKKKAPARKEGDADTKNAPRQGSAIRGNT